MPRTLVLFLAFTVAPAALFAQTYVAGPILGVNYYGRGYILTGRIKPVQADVSWDSTIQTPWGSHTLRNTGKFWRSSNGSGREDDTYGRSLVYDRKNHQWIELDHQLRTALVRPTTDEIVYLGDAQFFGGSEMRKGFDQMTGTLEGRKTLGGHKSAPSEAMNDFVLWWDIATGILVDAQTTHFSGQAVLRLRLRNLREVEPDPALFQIPDGYRVTYCNVSSSNPAGPKGAPYPMCELPSARPSR